MKVSEIYIEDWRQFKDFRLDLTYPKGHEKEGQPLDKVCFIGQSGTGKTTLLELIFRLELSYNPKGNSIYQFDFKTIYDNWNLIQLVLSFGSVENAELIFSIKDPNGGSIQSKRTSELNKYFKSVGQLRSNKNQNLSQWKGQNRLNTLIYFPHFDSFNKISNEKDPYWNSKKRMHFIEFEPTTGSFKGVITESYFEKMWTWFKDELETYVSQILSIKLKAAGFIETNFHQAKELAEQARKQEQKGHPILNGIAQTLDPILKKFELRVKTTIENKNQTDNLFFINFNDQTINREFLSTGINSLLYKTLPLFHLQPENSILLIDEPENSLYPDIQAQIVDHYTRLAPTSQFFFATHSPIIASSFEPWEIVELKFNEEGKVYREAYYEGENHVDNYTIFPKRLTYGEIYKEVFDLKKTAHPEREEKIKEAAKLRAQAKKAKQEGKDEKAQKQYKEYQDLADTLKWQLNEEDLNEED